MRETSGQFFWVALIGLAAITYSCGGRREGTDMGIFDRYKEDYRKGAERMAVERAVRDRSEERLRRYLAWLRSAEGKSAIRARTAKVYEAPVGFLDTVYKVTPGGDFTISSMSAGAILSGYIDVRSDFAPATLRRSDGRERHFRNSSNMEMLTTNGDGPLDDDEQTAAALLRSNPHPGWPGRAILKIRSDEQEIAKRMWEEMTGEKLDGS